MLRLSLQEFRTLQGKFGEQNTVNPKGKSSSPRYCYFPDWHADYIEHKFGASKPATAEHKVAMSDKARREKALADKAEIQVAQLRGELFHVDEVAEIFVKRGQKIKEGLELGDKAGSAEEAMEVMREKLTEADGEILAIYQTNDRINRWG